MILGFCRRHRFLILLGLLFILLRLPSLFEPYWYGDEGVYLTLGQAIRHHITLYSQIHDNKPPTLYYFAALAQTVFGFRLLLLLWMVPTVVYFFKLSCHFFKPTIAFIVTILFTILSSVPLVEGNIANSEIFMLLPTVLGFYLFFEKKYLLSALSLGFAFTLKVPVVVEFAFLVGWIVFFTKKQKLHINDLVKSVVIFLLPISLYGIHFYLQNAFKDFFSAAILQNFGYLSSWGTAAHSSTSSGSGLPTRLAYLAIFFFLIFGLSLLKKVKVNSAFILLWFAFTLFGSLLSGRPYPHYLIQVLPPLCLMIGLIISREYYATISLIVLAYVIYKFHFYFYPVFSYYKNSYSYILGKTSLENYRSFFGSDLNDLYQISEYIKSKTSPNDRILVWGDMTVIYPLADRLPASKYTIAYHIADFNGYQQTIDSIKTYMPKFIVYFPMANRPFTELDHIVNNYYFATKIVGNTLIYQSR